MLHRRLLLSGFVACALVLAGGSAFAERWEAGGAAAAAEPVQVKATRLAGFEKSDPARVRFGRLEFRGGLVLTSDHARFGGLSDLLLSPDGQRFLAVTDEGSWLAGDIVLEGKRPAGLANVRLGPLLALSGRQLDRKRNQDAEGMALLSGDLERGIVLIAFERNQRIGRFPVRNGAVGAPTSYMKLPDDARRMKPNQGIEALTVLRGGRNKGAVLAISERLLDADGNHTGWLWTRNSPRPIAIRNIGEFDITSAAGLDDGSVILLERRYRWMEGVKMRLRLVPAAALTAGTLIEGETLFEADMSYEVDNMEGVAVHTGPQGETVLTVLSDNNFNTALQRTLLLQFTLLNETAAASGSR